MPWYIEARFTLRLYGRSNCYVKGLLCLLFDWNGSYWEKVKLIKTHLHTNILILQLQTFKSYWNQVQNRKRMKDRYNILRTISATYLKSVCNIYVWYGQLCVPVPVFTDWFLFYSSIPKILHQEPMFYLKKRLTKFAAKVTKWSVQSKFRRIYCATRKHSSRMRTDRAMTRMSSDGVDMRPIVNRMTDRQLWKHYLPLRSVKMCFRWFWTIWVFSI